MSATLPLPEAASESAEDRFRYGWRYVQRTDGNGKVHFEMIPLTLEDALHPQEEDHYMVTDSHTRDLRYLSDVFEARLADSPGAIVLSDCRIAWDVEGKYAHGPDVAVIFEVRERQDWATFNVVEEGTRPALIVEVTSPSTRVNDVKEKVREYAEVGVPRYVIVDADESNGTRTISFIHYQLQTGSTRYEEVPISANGRIWLPEVKLWLGADDGRAACFDARGQRMDDYLATARARTAAEERAEASAQRIEAAEQAITAEVEARMADIKARKEAERQLVEKEARLRELEAEVRQLRGE